MQSSPGPAEAALAAAIAGACALALAMGIGRFAYTPLLPAMLEGGGLSLSGAGLVASANFAGYLAGALLATRAVFARHRALGLRAGIALSVATTAVMALDAGAAGWALLRFAGGMASAFVLVYASGTIFDLAARTARPMLGSLLYSGVGAGIALSALVVFAGRSAGMGAPSLWLAMGAIAALLAIPPWRRLAVAARPQAAPAKPAPAPAGAARSLRFLLVGYGCLGFGYVITATFIVVMVRRLPDAPAWEFWAWLAVGLAGAPSNWIWAKIAARTGPYRAIVAAFVLEAIGVALAALGSGPPAILVGAALLGGTFMAITALGLSTARALAADRPDQTIARMTVAFSVGQIVGPAIGGWLAERSGSFVSASWLAVAALLAGAALTAAAGRALRGRA
ncbi:MFS transporter [Burkholderiaceae bacterium FT117]|uniref:YbfB/YjiJ family MFS transporter n=1 Tax=Zeimonas sediminis TaxID=2944268 RepID=UPI00234301DF|nr:YbfB/YjiJ family MFS transporter [Zeimonas sediminis]MCM5569125.1 MFS transporter [Zeimonas sediminis]